MPKKFQKYMNTIVKITMIIEFNLLSQASNAAPVTVDDWVARLSVFYAAVAIMIIVDGVALYFILKALRRSGSGG